MQERASRRTCDPSDPEPTDNFEDVNATDEGGLEVPLTPAPEHDFGGVFLRQGGGTGTHITVYILHIYDNKYMIKLKLILTPIYLFGHMHSYKCLYLTHI